MRRLGAIGTLVWDRIWHLGAAEPVEQWGGAVYALASLSASCPREWQIDPIMKIGADLRGIALEYLQVLPNVHPGPGIRTVPEKNNVVELRYRDAAHRLELQLGGVPGWAWTEIEPLLPAFDALYVNFISGCELDLETMLRVRRAFPGPIYGDLHSLFLTAPGDGPRSGRALPRWREWLSCFDIVQLNETELGLLAGAPPESISLAKLLDHGPRLILVTLAERGVRYAVQDGLPGAGGDWRARPRLAELHANEAPPPDGALPGDPTGCGDVWGSACFNGLLGGLPLDAAISRAQHFAALKIMHPRTARLHERLRSAR